jgi:predicted PurR-regulated permease PerM
VRWLGRFRETLQKRQMSAAEPSPESSQARTATAVSVKPTAGPDHPVDEDVPRGVRLGAAWSWRGLVIAAVVWVLLQIIGKLQLVLIPFAIALLLAAMLQPMVAWLRRRGVPPSLAAALVLIAGLTVVGGTLAAVVREFVNGYQDLSDNVEEGIGKIREWLNDGPLHLSNDQIDNLLTRLKDAVAKYGNQDLTNKVLDTATTAGHVLAGFFLVLFTLFFLLKDGNIIWAFLVRLLPRNARAAVDQAGQYSWLTLISYVRATVLVAAVDAVGIGAAVWLLGVPLALPLAALVFLTSFIPIIGATLSGAVAVLVALVAKGPVVALIVLAAVIAVQQLEGHVLQPLLMGRAVAIHPIAVLFAIGGGAVMAGIVGALVAVPIVAVVNTGVRYLHRHRYGERVSPGEAEPPGTEPTDEEAVDQEKLTDAAAAAQEAAQPKPGESGEG